MSTPVDLFQLGLECGCAAKVPAGQLKDILRGIDLPPNAHVVVGPETLDDAGVYELPSGELLVQTVDFFPPVARTARDYGRIAAANALSDVYAMGGRPLTALAIVCFPAKTLGLEVLADITRGALEKLAEAGVALLGGHSVVDPQPKYGLCVTGIVKREELLDNASAAPGDLLLLTKPLGTGVTLNAVRAGLADAATETELVRNMASLNAAASRLAVDCGAKACTDITGFGLLGHALQLARASGVSLVIGAQNLKLLPGALERASFGLLPAAAYSNRDYVGAAVRFDEEIDLATRDLFFDPQTSGGLLIACPVQRAALLASRAAAELDTEFSFIGQVTERASSLEIAVRPWLDGLPASLRRRD